MSQISAQPLKQNRVPTSESGININSCSNPNCSNFTVAATNHRNDPNYLISGTKRNGSSLQCKKCSKFYSIKSNQAIAEEIERMEYKKQRATTFRQDGTACSNTCCSNFGKKVSHNPEFYRFYGRTSSGNQRVQCLNCSKIFTQGSEKRKNHPQSKAHQNTNLFRLLVNQMSINRIMEVTQLSAPTIYRKIDMFYERCVSFSYSREQQLKNMKLGIMRLSTDRQEYHVNWSNRKDKKNVVMTAIGTADKASRYVFGMDVNYDSSIDLNEVELSNEYAADINLKNYNRRHARIWTTNDYESGKQLANRAMKKKQDLLSMYSNLSLPLSDIGFDNFIEQLAEDNGIEPLDLSASTKLPHKGVQIHSEYTMYAHFHKLHDLIGHADKLRFYLDKEPAINRACNLAFSEHIQAGKLQSLYIKINKDLTVDQRRTLVNQSQKLIENICLDHSVDEKEARLILAKSAYKSPFSFNHKNELWFRLLIDKIYECEKHISFLTPFDSISDKEKAILLLDATLQPIDNFFQVVRRRLSGLERPISTSSNSGRVWTGKSPYNPEMVSKQLQILRVFHNFCFVSKIDNKTAAERIGLAKGEVEIRKILYP